MPTAIGCYENGAITSYEGNAICLSDLCLNNLIDVYNTKPIPGLDALVGQEIPVSRQQAMFLPFLAPLFIALIGLLVLFFPKCAPCLTCCTMCSAPCFFIFVGGLFFPLVILTGDICANMEPIAVTAIDGIEPGICGMVPNSAVNADGFCELAVDTDFFTWTFELDASELFSSLTVTCSGSSTANTVDREPTEPVAQLWQALEENSGGVVNAQIEKAVNEQLPTLIPFKLRQPLVDVIYGTADDLEDDVRLVARATSVAVSCESISAIYLGIKDTLCCDLFGALYWWAASFYLMGFTILCCGLPASLLAKSRLTNTKITKVMKDQAQRANQNLQQFRENGGFSGSFRGGFIRPGAAPVVAEAVMVEDNQTMTNSGMSDPYMNGSYPANADETYGAKTDAQVAPAGPAAGQAVAYYPEDENSKYI